MQFKLLESERPSRLQEFLFVSSRIYESLVRRVTPAQVEDTL